MKKIGQGSSHPLKPLYEAPTESEKRAKEYWDRPEFKVKETGTNADGSTWIRYPAVGDAWQNDKFINEQVRKDMGRYA